MKIRLLLSGMIAMFLFAHLGHAKESKREKDHEALRKLCRNVEHAIGAGNFGKLETFFAEDFAVTMPDQTRITSREELKTYLQRMFESRSSPLTDITTEIKADVLTRFTGPNTGYCFGRSEDVYTLKNEREIAVDSKWSAMVVKNKGAWKIKLVHVGVNFLDNPVLEYESMSWFGKLLVFLNLRKAPGETTK